MSPDARQIAKSLQSFAALHAMNANDYQIFLRSNSDWGIYHVIFAARDFAGIEGNPWFAIMHFLDDFAFDDPDLLDSINLTVSTFAQIQSGGTHAIGWDYEQMEGSLSNEPAA